MFAGGQTILSTDGMFRADFRAFADNLLVYRTIGGIVVTFKKVTRTFLFISYSTWVADTTTAVVLNVTFLSAPDPFNQTRRTRSASTHNRPGSNSTNLALTSFGLSVSMDAAISGLPDPQTLGVSPDTPPLPVQSVSAIALITFPGGEPTHKLTLSDSF